MKALLREFWQEEDGLQTIELVLILVVLVGLAITFGNYATNWVNTVLKSVDTNIKNAGPWISGPGTGTTTTT